MQKGGKGHFWCDYFLTFTFSSSKSLGPSISIPPGSSAANQPITISAWDVRLTKGCVSSCSSVAANMKSPFCKALTLLIVWLVISTRWLAFAGLLSKHQAPAPAVHLSTPQLFRYGETADLMGANMGQWLMHERRYFKLMASAKCKSRPDEEKEQ